MKNKIIILISSALLCTILIIILHKICLEQNLKVGDFERNITENNLILKYDIDLPEEIYSFIGVNSSQIFLTTKGLDKILKYDTNLKTYSSKKINHKNHNSNIVGDSIFSFDPYLKKLFIYDLNNFKLKNETNLNVTFDRAIAINKNLILLRSSTEKYTKNILSSFDLKENVNKKLKIQLADSLEVDGGLKTDGFFTYNNNDIIFTQYKKGNFYKIDKNLNNITRYRTNDNIQKVEGVKLTKELTFIFTKPVLNVNLLTAISDKNVYIVSFVKGKNDQLNKFTKYRIIDVYSLKTGLYLKSFYLPNNGIEKVNDIFINNNLIYLLFNKKIQVYEIN
jgi:hypothetical protein